MNGFVSATHTHTLLKQTEQDRCGGGPIWEEKQSVIPQEKLLTDSTNFISLHIENSLNLKGVWLVSTQTPVCDSGGFSVSRGMGLV
ncbi:hypothetical protein OUZ56_030361 [Daphnia magna]|uniref:Uncharacterized protein n=1 Tax=Daphnia magna TaxID=35525 RepID=A0ABQ9ZR23_9CRUS|nr:hypothetical protein OUZ56_030361 [Daphnia magna]